MEVLSIFNCQSASRDHKLHMAFALHDFDGDGAISKQDLVQYFEAVMSPPEGGSIDRESVAARILLEASSAPDRQSLTYTDFAKVVVVTEFAAKLHIPLAGRG